MSAATDLGGVALATSFLGVATLIYFLYPSVWGNQSHIHLAIVWTGLAVFFLGLWDEHKPLGWGRRVFLQAAIATAAYAQGIQVDAIWNPFAGISHPLGVASAPITVLWLVGLTSLVHLAGQMRGWSAAFSPLVATFLLLVGLVGAGTDGFPVLCAVGIAGSLLACILVNLGPGRVRIGKAGAGFCGFLVASLSTLNPDHGATLAASVLFALLALPGAGTAMLLRSASRDAGPGGHDSMAASPRFLLSEDSRRYTRS